MKVLVGRAPFFLLFLKNNIFLCQKSANYETKKKINKNVKF